MDMSVYLRMAEQAAVRRGLGARRRILRGQIAALPHQPGARQAASARCAIERIAFNRKRLLIFPPGALVARAAPDPPPPESSLAGALRPPSDRALPCRSCRTEFGWSRRALIGVVSGNIRSQVHTGKPYQSRQPTALALEPPSTAP